MNANQYRRNEKRINRALNRIVAIWRDAYDRASNADMIAADIKYNRALHMRAKVLRIVNGGGHVRAS